MSGRSYLSIGELLTLLRQEFPDITISKIRFLESQGLVNPERTPSGYRKFYDHDVERLRWVLRQQREHFLPLKVIKDRLEDGQEQPVDEAAVENMPSPAETLPSLVAVGAQGGASDASEAEPHGQVRRPATHGGNGAGPAAGRGDVPPVTSSTGPPGHDEGARPAATQAPAQQAPARAPVPASPRAPEAPKVAEPPSRPAPTISQQHFKPPEQQGSGPPVRALRVSDRSLPEVRGKSRAGVCEVASVSRRGILKV